MSHLVVSTECPLCGAPLDFAEGSNAVRCQHCRSNLLVTMAVLGILMSVARETDLDWRPGVREAGRALGSGIVRGRPSVRGCRRVSEIPGRFASPRKARYSTGTIGRC